MRGRKLNFRVREKLILFVIAVGFAVFVSAQAPSFIISQIQINFSEDQVPIFNYNFTANVSNPSGYVLTFSIINITHGSDPNDISFYTWVSMNSSTGVLTMNVTNKSQVGYYNISIYVSSAEEQGESRWFYFNVDPINDPPLFLSIENQTMYINSTFSYNLTGHSEDNDGPYIFNISFLSCWTEEWSTRNTTDCQLFNTTTNVSTSYDRLNITFRPTKNDVGSYILNVSIADRGNATLGLDPISKSYILNFTVGDVNTAPLIKYACNNSRAGNIEGNAVSCYLNASDIGEKVAITFAANYDWFLSGTHSVPTNLSVNYTAGKLISFTPNLTQVGNWSVNVTFGDTNDPPAYSYSVFWFFTAHTNHSVYLEPIGNRTFLNTFNYTVNLNASDMDLTIPISSGNGIYNRTYENLTFVTNESSWMTSLGSINVANTNISTGRFTIDPQKAGVGIHFVNITVRDRFNYSVSSRIFNFTVLSNTLPFWVANTKTNFTFNEGERIYFNFSMNTSDPDIATQSLTFSARSPLGMGGFNLNANTGVVNYTSDDIDVGEHLIEINVSDGGSQVPMLFNITVYNVNDAPIKRVLYVTNGLFNEGTKNITLIETNYTTFLLYLEDNDFLIPQKNFYNESHNFIQSLIGPSGGMFNFSYLSGPNPSENFTVYRTQFTPARTDVGKYNLTVNVTDLNLASLTFGYNVTVLKMPHAPVLNNITNLSVGIGEIVSFTVNATDLTDFYPLAPGSNMSFTIRNLTQNGNFLSINLSSGLINSSTLIQANVGSWTYNVTVNNTDGLSDSKIFNLTVYDYPKILSPNMSSEVLWVENQTYNLIVRANHTLGDNLNYSLYVRGGLRNSTIGYGNGSNVSLSVTTNFTDETTCSGKINLTLVVQNSALSNSSDYNLTISHTDFPVILVNPVGGNEMLVSGGSPQVLDLTDYFVDYDASDGCNNQTIGFGAISRFISGTPIAYVSTDWTNGTKGSIIFSASSSGVSNYSIIASEYNLTNSSQIIKSLSSNDFTVSITQSSPPPTVISGGGGGGSTKLKPVSLKLLVPNPVASNRKDKLVLPIGVENTGSTDFTNIVLRATIAKDGVLRKDIIATFDNSLIPTLPVGAKQNVTLIVDVNTEFPGTYEITLNGTAEKPVYSDWAKIYLTIEEGKKVEEKVVFLEQLLIDNPICLELKERVDEAKRLLDAGNLTGSESIIEETIESCKGAIVSQQVTLDKDETSLWVTIIEYVVVASVCAFALGILFYLYRRASLRRVLKRYETYD